MNFWRESLEAYDKMYNMFSVNRKYRDRSFKSEQDYLDIQKKLAEKIDEQDRSVEKEIRKLIREAYPEVKILKFDSRMCSAPRLVLGRALTKNVESLSTGLEIEKYFEKTTSFKVHIDRLEDFPEEEREKILKEVRE